MAEHLMVQLVTPTGAVIIAFIAQHFGSIPPMEIDRAGWAYSGQVHDQPGGQPALCSGV